MSYYKSENSEPGYLNTRNNDMFHLSTKLFELEKGKKLDDWY
jgi:hypothetical protein